MMGLSLRARLLLGASGMLLAGLAVGWLTAEDGPDAMLKAPPAETWQEPAQQSADAEKLLAGLKDRSLWGDAGGGGSTAADEAAKAAAAAAANAEWRLSGIVSEHGKSLAVIMTPGVGKAPPHVQYNRIGDALPDGSHIVQIEKTAITVAGDSGQRQVRMFLPK